MVQVFADCECSSTTPRSRRARQVHDDDGYVLRRAEALKGHCRSRGSTEVRAIVVGGVLLFVGRHVAKVRLHRGDVSTWSAVGEVSDVVVPLIPSLTRALTATEAVLVVLQLPALPLHCAFAWLTLRADPSTVAARRKRVAFISNCSKVYCWFVSRGRIVTAVIFYR